MNVISGTPLLAHLQKVIRDLRAGLPLKEAVLALEVDDPALAGLTEEILQLAKQYEESRRFVLGLAKGKLEIDAPPRNHFVAPFKELQAELRHLTWQVQAISRGDLKQRVTFSGDLAKAIDTMVEGLQEKAQLDEKNRLYAQELEELNARLAEMASMDSLTGILNRRSFDQRLEQEIQRVDRFRSRFCLLMFDVDHFKRFNDTYGHAIGDLVLVSLCSLVGMNIRQVDGLFRFGGEEFMVILSETNQSQGLLVAEHIRNLVEDMTISQAPMDLPPITISVGVCSSEQVEPLDAIHIVKAVDQALYDAKSSGRNCVRVAPGIAI